MTHDLIEPLWGKCRINMRGRYRAPMRERGFAGVVLLAILVGSLLVAAFSYMGRQSTSGISDSSARLNAAIVMRQGNTLTDAVEDVHLSRNVPIEAMTFDADPVTGVFAVIANARVPSVLLPPLPAMEPGTDPATNRYTLSHRIALPGLGSVADDVAIVLAHVAKPVCQQINAILYADSTSVDPVVSSGSVHDWSSGHVDDVALGAGYAGRSEGCVRGADGPYIYFRAVLQN